MLFKIIFSEETNPYLKEPKILYVFSFCKAMRDFEGVII